MTLSIDHLFDFHNIAFFRQSVYVVFIVPIIKKEKVRLRKSQQCAQNHEGP